MISLSLHEDIIKGLHINVEGCALCEAGAGLLSEISHSASTSDILAMRDDLTSYLKQQVTKSNDKRFDAFQPVQKIKNRHKCVMLAFDAFEKATQ